MNNTNNDKSIVRSTQVQRDLARQQIDQHQLKLRQRRVEHLDTRAPYVIQVHIAQPPAAPIDDRQGTYITEKSKGTEPKRAYKLPQINVLTLTASLILMVLFCISASMASIALTAYSNSVERVDKGRIIHYAR